MCNEAKRMGVILLASILAVSASGSASIASAQTASLSTSRAKIVAFTRAVLPRRWAVYSGDIQHNSAYDPDPGSALDRLSGRISWIYAEENALPLSEGKGKDDAALGSRLAPVKTTQFLGNAVGVSVVGDVLYAESDSGYIYSLDASTGRLIWSTQVDNAAMGNPVVVDGNVFVGTGDTGFSFEEVLQAQASAAGHKQVHLVRGLGWSAVYALDSITGKILWRYGTRGEDMPSECYGDNTLYFANGDGHFYALDPKTGHPRWITQIGGFDSMSSCTIYEGKVLAGFTDPNNLAAVDMKTGAVEWKTTFPNVANTGMGDNSPTIDLQDRLVIQVAVARAENHRGSMTVNTVVLAVNPDDGKLVWKTLLGRGPTPPAYKASVAMVHDGIIYVSSPATNKIYALHGATGRILWSSLIPHPEAPGMGRGAVTYDNGVLYQATGASLFMWNAKNGNLLNSKMIGGRFGIDNPVIVGNTIFLTNSWDWLIALPKPALSAER